MQISYYSPTVCPYSKEKATVGVQFNEMLIEQWVNESISAAGAVLRSSLDKRTLKMWSSLN